MAGIWGKGFEKWGTGRTCSTCLCRRKLNGEREKRWATSVYKGKKRTGKESTHKERMGIHRVQHSRKKRGGRVNLGKGQEEKKKYGG